MSFSFDDTIAALASAPGPGLRGVIRIGGPDVRGALKPLFQSQDAQRWKETRRAERHAGTIVLPHFPPVAAAVYFWPTARSYTGQPLAELHLIGSPPLLEAVLSELYRCGVRPARPGEFTLRAFLAGRVDLVQAEAVLGVIDADSQQALQTALGQLAGGISGRIGGLRSTLLELLADLEAGLDFVDEDIEFVAAAEVVRRLAAAEETVSGLLAQADARMQTRTGRRVVLAGLPNAGKSTLFNVLAGRQRALVSSIAGTTQDYLQATLDLGEWTVELIDTAGWDPNRQGIAAAAQQLRNEQVQQADLLVWCTAADLDRKLRDHDWKLRSSLDDALILDVHTKADLGPARIPGSLCVSARTAVGIPQLVEEIRRRLAERAGGELLGTTAARCRDSLSSAQTALTRAGDSARHEGGDELVAVELRIALEALGQVVGAVYTEDLLDRIFSKFCIGK